MRGAVWSLLQLASLAAGCERWDRKPAIETCPHPPEVAAMPTADIRRVVIMPDGFVLEALHVNGAIEYDGVSIGDNDTSTALIRVDDDLALTGYVQPVGDSAAAPGGALFAATGGPSFQTFTVKRFDDVEAPARWSIDLDGGASYSRTPIVADDGLVVVDATHPGLPSMDETIDALDASTGSPRWRASFKEIDDLAMLPDGDVLASIDRSRLVRIARGDGAVTDVHAFAVTQWITRIAVASDGSVAEVTEVPNDRTVVRVVAATGEVRWMTEMTGKWSFGWTRSGELLLLGGGYPTAILELLAGSDGAEVHSEPACAANLLAINAQDRVIVSYDGRLVAWQL